jgi:hypothetical protein
VKLEQKKSGYHSNFEEFKDKSVETVVIIIEGTRDTYEGNQCFLDPAAKFIATKYPILVVDGCGSEGGLTGGYNTLSGEGSFGFTKVPMEVSNQLTLLLKSSDPNRPIKVLIGGHSRGAVIAAGVASHITSLNPGLNLEFHLFLHDPVIGPEKVDADSPSSLKHPSMNFFEIPKSVETFFMAGMLNEDRAGFGVNYSDLTTKNPNGTFVSLSGPHAKGVINYDPKENNGLTYLFIQQLWLSFLNKHLDMGSFNSQILPVIKATIDDKKSCQAAFLDPTNEFQEFLEIWKIDDESTRAKAFLRLLSKSHLSFNGELSTEKGWSKIKSPETSTRRINEFFDVSLKGFGGDYVIKQMQIAFPTIVKVFYEGDTVTESNKANLQSETKEFESTHYDCIRALINYSRQPLKYAISISESDSEGVITVSTAMYQVCSDNIPLVGNKAPYFHNKETPKMLGILGKTVKDNRPYIELIAVCLRFCNCELTKAMSFKEALIHMIVDLDQKGDINKESIRSKITSYTNIPSALTEILNELCLYLLEGDITTITRHTAYLKLDLFKTLVHQALWPAFRGLFKSHFPVNRPIPVTARLVGGVDTVLLFHPQELFVLQDNSEAYLPLLTGQPPHPVDSPIPVTVSATNQEPPLLFCPPGFFVHRGNSEDYSSPLLTDQPPQQRPTCSQLNSLRERLRSVQGAIELFNRLLLPSSEMVVSTATLPLSHEDSLKLLYHQFRMSNPTTPRPLTQTMERLSFNYLLSLKQEASQAGTSGPSAIPNQDPNNKPKPIGPIEDTHPTAGQADTHTPSAIPKKIKVQAPNLPLRGLLSTLFTLCLFTIRAFVGYQQMLIDTALIALGLHSVEALVYGVFTSKNKGWRSKISQTFAKSYEYTKNNVSKLSTWLSLVCGGCYGAQYLKLITPNTLQTALKASSFAASILSKSTLPKLPLPAIPSLSLNRSKVST